MIRSKIQTFNTQLDTYKEVVNESMLTTGIAIQDRALAEQCQEKTSCLQFVASVEAFSFYWETMTRDKHIRYIYEYVDTEYSIKTEDVRQHIKQFLVNEIVTKKNGFKLVQWNGYFIERLPELSITHVDTKTKSTTKKESIEAVAENESDVIVKFKVVVANTPDEKDNCRKHKDAPFNVMRAKLQREKQSFFVA